MKRVIFITGASSGIGLCAAKILLSKGYRILAGCRKEADLITMKTLGFEPIKIDMDNVESVKYAAQQVIELTNGRLYALFNNAGYGVYGSLNTLSRQQLEQQFSTNFFSIHQLTTLLLPAMLAHGEGRIIQTSSLLGIVSSPGRGAYAASKHALEAWSDALRLELKGSGVQVCIIEPGPIETRFTDNVEQTNKDSPVKNPTIAAKLALRPEHVVKRLLHALESPKPKIRYPVTILAYAIAFMKRLLPDRMMDKFLT
ncbi:SDR family oxidoreductase [Arsenophonus apicola]|uniref:SDR family oxidoreductase n=1 Tax=Arsenophonus apicola TaxID=2879119 RepID=A0ABY8P3X0_9GAMM|nr:SDR family oxidoreductase [Arsenophonus apicola]WGO84177.1 SDR family oxidoreductase [Arsenophonus apicola]